MGAPRKNNPRRAAAAVVAAGVVSSLTALTVGLAPAGAKPADPVVPPTPVVVAPAAPAEVAEAPAREAPPREAPSAPIAPSEVVAPVIPVAPQAPAEPVAPPVVVAPSAPQTEEPAPEPTAPSTIVAPAPKPVVVDPPVAPSSASVPAPRSVTPSVAPAPPVESSEQPTVERKPDRKPAETPDSAAPVASTAPEAPAPVLPGLVAPSVEPSIEAAPPSAAGDGPSAPAEQDKSDAAQATSRPSGGETSAAPSTPAVAEARPAIKTEAPKTLEAPTEDVQVALSAKVVEEKPLPAAKVDVDAFASVVKSSASSRDGWDGNGPRDKGGPFDIANRDGNRGNDFDRDRGDDRHDGNHRVRQWDPHWVSYDDYYRPVICNPYRQPVRIVYIYQNTPRIVIINPLARVVLDVAQYAAYSFTAVVANAANQATNVAVGSFFGGGYYPGYGAPLPPPPPPVLRYDNVPVQVRYPQATYQPFRVQRIVDVGDDAQYGERKVLLDGVTPAWGEWTQTPAGERQFEVHKTQQFPGLDEPGTGPLPGDYQLRLASDEARPGMDPKSIYLGVVAGALAVMSLGAVAWSVMLGRRRSQS
ncbi:MULTISPECIES: hypothetical protein [unclassified Mycobacterium]|uniref:hypothetical protein n=1 Tax=unclassified Mycobacterium TaxID=2642494 RepID=UPI0029C92123|nr:MULTISPECIES: hypothetical protein [unclassified Mycobacterium]